MEQVLSNFEEKEHWFLENSKSEFWKFSSVSAFEFYRDLFPVGTFEERVGHKENYEKTNKGNGFIVYQVGSGEKAVKHTRMVFDDLKELHELLGNPCAFMSPISYFGRNRTAKNARYLYALAFDLDEVGKEQIDLLFGFWIYHKRIPCPTYVVNSGGGVHLYYFFKEPIPMTPKNQKALKILKYELTTRIWNEDTSGLKERQYQGLNQGFRLVGSKTKRGETVTCWKTGERTTVEELVGFIPKENAKDVGIIHGMWHSQMSIEEAKEKYPEWYEQRIVMGRRKMSWTCNRNLYDWWLRQAEKASKHHRYWFIFALTVYAKKCEVPFDELKKDAFGLKDFMNKIDAENPFTDEDILSALKAYDEEHKSFTRNEISHLTAIEIKANKRNGRKQSEHVKLMNFIRDEINQNLHWRNENGRPSKEIEVFKYLCDHPTATKAEVIRGTGLSRPTVYKYYDEQIFIAQQEKYANENHISKGYDTAPDGTRIEFTAE